MVKLSWSLAVEHLVHILAFHLINGLICEMSDAEDLRLCKYDFGRAAGKHVSKTHNHNLCGEERVCPSKIRPNISIYIWR